MSFRVAVDGSVFTFPDGWSVEKIDEWPEQKKLTALPYKSKACDLVAVDSDRGTVWLIEAKDYTYPGASVPNDLAESLGMKFFHSLAILHAVARWGDGANARFSRQVLACSEARVCLSVELDARRKLVTPAEPLAHLLGRMKHVVKKMQTPNASMVVSSSSVPGGVPWRVARDPTTRRARMSHP